MKHDFQTWLHIEATIGTWLNTTTKQNKTTQYTKIKTKQDPKHPPSTHTQQQQQQQQHFKKTWGTTYFFLFFGDVDWKTLEADIRFSMYWPSTWFSDFNLRFSSFTLSTLTDKSILTEENKYTEIKIKEASYKTTD